MNLPSAHPSLMQRAVSTAGRWTTAVGDELVVENPATGRTLATLPRCGDSEARAAVAAAAAAFPAWRKVPAPTKARVLRDWAALVRGERENLALLLTLEQGKPLAEARAEVDYGAEYIEWFAEEARRIYGSTMPAPTTDRRIVCLREPVGVVGCITPWNFPIAMLARKIAPALAAGCTVVAKPAELTPLSAFALAALAEDAGIPAGVLNVVCGDAPAIGAVLTGSPTVRKLSFTGSTAVGRRLLADGAATVTRTTLELGGNAPFIVFDDADLDAALAGVMVSKFRNAGQTCVCANRILVQQAVFDRFAAALVTRVKALRVGDGLAADVDIGPLVSHAAAARVHALLDDALAGGACDLTASDDAPPRAPWVRPTVLTQLTPAMRIWREEIFGPLATLVPFSDEAHALTLANDTEYGLAAYVYTRDAGRMWRMGEGLECGMVGINEAAISNVMAPFGGVKQSGHGREGSRYGLDDYLEHKYLCMGGLQA